MSHGHMGMGARHLRACVMFTVAWPFATHAADIHPPDLIQAEVGIRQVQMELKDLAPDDGIAPSIGFASTGHLQFDFYGPFLSSAGPTYTNSLLPATTLSKTDSVTANTPGTYSATATPDSFVLQGGTSTQQLLARLQTESGKATSSASIHQVAGITGWSDNGPPVGIEGGMGTFTLSAHTQMVLRGEVVNTLTLDPTGVQAWLAGSGFNRFGLTVTNHNEQGPSLYFYTPMGGSGLVSTSYTFADPQAFRLPYQISGVTQSTQGPVQYGGSSLFEIVVSNQSDQSYTGEFDLTLGTTGYVNLVADVHDGGVPTPQVPEPSAYLLAVAGLAVLGWRGKRAR